MIRSNIIQQWRRLEEVSKAYKESNKKLIETAKKIDPSIKTREQALALADKLAQGGK